VKKKNSLSALASSFPILLKSHLPFAPLYWYVTACGIEIKDYLCQTQHDEKIASQQWLPPAPAMTFNLK
jgi:hypothetical protein